MTWVVARRRTRASDLLDAEAAWAELVRRLEALGVSWPTSTTPRHVPVVVAGTVRARTGTDLPDAAVESLDALVTALETERYARDAEPSSPARLRELLETTVGETERSLSDRPARVDAPTAPRAG